MSDKKKSDVKKKNDTIVKIFTFVGKFILAIAGGFFGIMYLTPDFLNGSLFDVVDLTFHTMEFLLYFDLLNLLVLLYFIGFSIYVYVSFWMPQKIGLVSWILLTFGISIGTIFLIPVLGSAIMGLWFLIGIPFVLPGLIGFCYCWSLVYKYGKILFGKS